MTHPDVIISGVGFRNHVREVPIPPAACSAPVACNVAVRFLGVIVEQLVINGIRDGYAKLPQTIDLYNERYPEVTFEAGLLTCHVVNPSTFQRPFYSCCTDEVLWFCVTLTPTG
jgi:hypothetical protein